jgi:hypothetical protein
LDASDNIIVGGGEGNGFALLRLNGSGEVDNTFASGLATTTFGDDTSSELWRLVVEDQQIVAVGTSGDGQDDRFTLVRYNADGSLDSNFGDSGISRVVISGDVDVAFGVAVDSAGRLLVGGTVGMATFPHFALAAYDAGVSGAGEAQITADAGGTDGTYTAAEGSKITLNGSGSLVSAGTTYTFDSQARRATASPTGEPTDGGSDGLNYSWDLNNDGVFDDASGATPEITVPDGQPYWPNCRPGRHAGRSGSFGNRSQRG